MFWAFVLTISSALLWLSSPLIDGTQYVFNLAERLKRPIRKTFGGKWVSFMGIPPMIFFYSNDDIQRINRKIEGKKKKTCNDVNSNENLCGKLVLISEVIIS